MWGGDRPARLDHAASVRRALAVPSEVAAVTLYIEPHALARAGLDEDELLALTAEPTTTELVTEWLANLPRSAPAPPAPPPLILYTATEIERIVARHPDLFGPRA